MFADLAAAIRERLTVRTHSLLRRWTLEQAVDEIAEALGISAGDA